jgi:hypothetical protein
MSTSSSKKSNTNIRKGRDGVRAYRPGVQDFKRRGDSSRTGRADTDRQSAIESQRGFANQGYG